MCPKHSTDQMAFAKPSDSLPGQCRPQVGWPSRQAPASGRGCGTGRAHRGNASAAHNLPPRPGGAHARCPAAGWPGRDDVPGLAHPNLVLDDLGCYLDRDIAARRRPCPHKAGGTPLSSTAPPAYQLATQQRQHEPT
jgi:hypothetical protein